jgi:hypothetical protein
MLPYSDYIFQEFIGTFNPGHGFQKPYGPLMISQPFIRRGEGKGFMGVM